MRKKTFVMAVVLIVVLAFGYMKFYHQSTVTQDEIPSWITQDLIYEADPSQRNLRRVNDIVIHYTANPGSTAKANRDYFAQDTTQVNSHFVVGLDGEIIQCVPLYMQSSLFSQFHDNYYVPVSVDNSTHTRKNGIKVVKFADTSVLADSI